jgi:protein PhnA
MEEEMKVCPQCECPYAYFAGDNKYNCPECSHIWDPTIEEAEPVLVVKDANGTILQNGDSVVVVKTLKVKGASGPVKAGTKVRRIRLQDSDHNIGCKIDGFGAMNLKSEFVKKV